MNNGPDHGGNYIKTVFGKYPGKDRDSAKDLT
jgi:hypothetical protein